MTKYGANSVLEQYLHLSVWIRNFCHSKRPIGAVYSNSENLRTKGQKVSTSPNMGKKSVLGKKAPF